ncbi:hypothetical protein SYN65AY6LI_03925 [Synechococcus sp. 65AY6Li]|nr:hypothetical protein SYN65AY6LI_03925 [Synechococcus sp. 65AY6Li]
MICAEGCRDPYFALHKLFEIPESSFAGCISRP